MRSRIPVGVFLAVTALCSLVESPAAQSGTQSGTLPGGKLTGVWVPMQGASQGALPPAGPVVLKAPYAAEYEARRAADAEATRRGQPPPSAAVLCNPYGMPRMMAVASYPIEILETPGRVTIITEAFSEVRRVHLNQQQLPLDEVPPGYYGHSVGRWEGDTLVIDTIGIKETVAGVNNIPHSSQLRIVERLRLASADVLHDEVTLHDPVMLEKPVTYTLGYRRMPDYKMVEFVCENNREYVDSEGRVRMRIGR